MSKVAHILTDIEKDRVCIEKPDLQIVDTYDEQIEELFEVENPSIFFAKDKKQRFEKWKKENMPKCVWVLYPWKNTLVKILPKKEFRQVRLSRNQNIISKKEQDEFANATVGFAGLSVGNPGAVCMALEGGGTLYKLADFDTLSLSNLNRFRASLCDLGTNKTTLTARHVGEIDPYLNIELFDKGLTPENIDKFLLEPKLDVLVEEMDNLPLKISIREKAREYGIPVIMVTGNGAGLVMDVERFDKDKNMKLMNGELPRHVINGIKALSEGRKKGGESLLGLARDFIGTVHVKRLRDSFDEFGKTLAGIPQISEATFLRGASICHMIRRIVVHGNIESGRYLLQLEDIIKE